MTDQEFYEKCLELKTTSARIREQLSKSSQDLDAATGRPANVPMRRYSPDDRIELTRPARRQPASARTAISGVNIPCAGETFQELNTWRARYGLNPVTR